MHKYCDHCGASEFRASHFRTADFSQLMIFKLPVRCTSCRERAFAFLPEFFRLRREHQVRRLARGQQR